MARMVFYWSGQPSEEDQKWIAMSSDIRKGLPLCDDCDVRVDCAIAGYPPEQNFQEALDMVKQYVAQTKCGEHHLPPMR